MKRIRIHSERLTLRNLKASDYPLWRHSHNNRKSKVNVFDPGPLPESELSIHAFKMKLKRWRDRDPLDGFCALGIFDLEETVLYGTLDIHFLNLELRWANLGFEISNSYWGRGIATEAARLGLQVAFTRLNAHRVEVGCDSENHASHAVIRKLGLNYEGTRKNFFPDEPGHLIVYALSQPEFNYTG